MTTYNTGNPVPSGDARDRFDNTQTLDELVTGTDLQTVNRLGRSLKTLLAMELEFNALMQSLGYVSLGDYDADGPLTVTSQNQIFSHDGEFYKAVPGLTLPYTTLNDWATDAPKFVSVGDAALRSQLANFSFGAGLVWGATRQVKTLADLKTTDARYDGDQVDLIEVKAGAVGSGGVFIWEASSVTTADDIRTVQRTGVTTGRWERKQQGYNFAMAGLIPNSQAAGVPEANATALEACRLAAGSNKIFAPPGNFYIAPNIWKQGSRSSYEGDSQNGGLGGTSFICTNAGNMITHENDSLLVEFANIKGFNFSALVPGVSAIRSASMNQYVSTLRVEDCNFQASLTECLYGNYIFLYGADNTFGYYGNVLGGAHRHVYCYGDTSGPNANVNVLERNRFYRAVGVPEAIMMRGGFQYTSRNNNYEQMDCRPVGLYGVTQPLFQKDWFEVANNATSFVYCGQNVGDPNVYNTQGTLFDNCHFEGTTGVIAQLVEIGSGGASVGFINPSGTNCNGTAFTKRDGILNAGISQFLDFGAFFGTPLYPSKPTGGHSFIAPISPAMSSRGYVDKPWLDGWTTGAPLGWSKTAITTWSGAASTTDFGNRIIIGSSASGANLIWLQVPVAYFAGKVIAIRARGQIASGSGDTFQIAASLSVGVPGDLAAVGIAANQGFSGTMGDVVGAFYVDPSTVPGAVYLNVGLRSGGWTGQTILEAFDFWIISGDILPHFAR